MTASPEIVIHIGLEKTGTTAIQKNIANNIELLNQKGWRSASEISDNHEPYNLAAAFTRFAYEKGSKLDASCVDRFREFLERYKDWNIVLSSEHLSSRLDDKEMVDSVIRLCRSSGHRPRIVCYVRDPEKWMLSHYCEVVKNGRCPYSLEHFVSDPGGMLPHIRWVRQIGAIVQLWRDASAGHRFDIYSYDKIKPDVHAHFFQSVLHIEAPRTASARENVGLDLRQIRIMAALHLVLARARFVPSHEMPRRVSKVLRRVAKPASFLAAGDLSETEKRALRDYAASVDLKWAALNE